VLKNELTAEEKPPSGFMAVMNEFDVNLVWKLIISCKLRKNSVFSKKYTYVDRIKEWCYIYIYIYIYIYMWCYCVGAFQG
jgi:hypothetical protein